MRIPAVFAVTLSLCLLAVPRLDGGEKTVHGRVTYFAAGTVYVSLGREQGLRDSTLLAVVSQRDTVATLQVLALSSRSSSCTVLRSTRSLSIGDEVVGVVTAADSGLARIEPGQAHSGLAVRPGDTLSAGSSVPRQHLLSAQGGFVDLHGRIGTQYISSTYDQSTFDITQPGVVLNLHGAMRDVPLKFDLYANLRTISYGSRNPFAKSAVNQSRVYGLSLSYDDGITVASLGRIIPLSSPSAGYVDGALLSRRFGNIIVGTVVGYQPDWTMRNISTDYRKIALFTQYNPPDRIDLSLSASYARTYYHSTLDREAASLLVNSALTEDLYLYGNVEMDLRKKLGEQLVLSPRLTSAYTTLYYRVVNSLTLGLGIDAARAFYSFESVRQIPDSLFDDDLRSGMTASVSWYLPGGISLQESYAPRASRVPFAQEYSNSAALSIADIFSTGVSLRGNFTTNRNEFTTMAGYGAAVQATIGRTVDLTLRFQNNGYTVRQTAQLMRGKAIGGDLMVFLTRGLTLLASYDRRDDYGMISNAIFAEFGFRF